MAKHSGDAGDFVKGALIGGVIELVLTYLTVKVLGKVAGGP